MSVNHSRLKWHIWIRNSMMMIYLTALGIAMYSNYLILWGMAIFCFSIIAYIYMYLDKRLAKKKGSFRYPEATFHSFGVLGGVLGVLIGMYMLRHKTQHVTFRIGMPILVILHVFINIMLWLW